MCTWITEKVAVRGTARGVADWMTVSQVNVFYDHPVEAPFDHAVVIDFVHPAAGVGARVGVELSAASAAELARAIEAALMSPEAERDLARERAGTGTAAAAGCPALGREPATAPPRNSEALPGDPVRRDS